MSEKTILDLDAMLDTNMDNVETLPDYVNPPAGLYVLDIKEVKIEKYKNKEGVEGNRIRVTYAVAETVEVADTKEPPVANGSLFSETFTATEDGIKFFKKSAMNSLGVANFEGASLRDVMDAMKNAQFKARITMRKSKDEATGKEYENIQIRAVREAA